jgi:leucyl/phenylalanyl-tRNA--protein transferase
LSLSNELSRSGGVALAAKPRRQSDRQRLREQLFKETPRAWAERNLLGIAYALKPERITSVPALIRIWLRDIFTRPRELPDPRSPLNADGAVGVARDLSVPTLIEATRRGLFPLGHVGRPKWRSPETRGVVFLDEFHIPKKLRKLLRQGGYRISFDQEFERVIYNCAGRRRGHYLTWVTPAMMWAYADLFDAGIAHSVEVWNEQDELVGGGYGVAVGQVFVGESLFSLAPNASKIAFVALAWHLAKWGCRFMDTKILTPVTTSLGFHAIERDQFLAELAAAVKAKGTIGRWQCEADLETLSQWDPQHDVAPRKPVAGGAPAAGEGV